PSDLSLRLSHLAALLISRYLSLPTAPLISYLPESTDELVSLYLKRHPKSTSSHESDWHSPALDAVVLDAVKYAHRSLVGQY
ncbi:hypothetical protein Pcinc_017552, partial [Petrolisthes cinctipes]